VLDLDLLTYNKKMAGVGLILAVRCTILSTHRPLHTPLTPKTPILRDGTVCGSRNLRHEHILVFNRGNGLEAAMSFGILPAMKAHEGPCWEDHRFTLGLISAWESAGSSWKGTCATTAAQEDATTKFCQNA
jgi:hypothetical protein